MEIEEIVVGERYKVTAVNTPGWWTVVSIANTASDPHIKIKKENGGKIRYVAAADIVAPVVKSTKKTIESESVRLIATFGDVQMWEEKVTYMPDEKRRGRKKKTDA